jgi:uncharacterized protein involved in exopolysaccharide biosynthesis
MMTTVLEQTNAAPLEQATGFSWKFYWLMAKRGWKTIAWTTGLIVLGCLFYLQFGTPYYQAQMTITPATNENQTSAALSNLSGLASMAGINIGSTGQTDFQKFQSLLMSRKVADQLAKNQYIMSKAFPKVWDAEIKRFVPPPGLTGVISTIFQFVVGAPGWVPPTGEDLHTYITKNVNIDSNIDGSIITVTFDHPDAAFASAFLTALHEHADAIMRDDARRTAERRTVYLNKLLESTTQDDQRQALITLLSTEQQKAMLAAVDKYYSAGVLDPPARTYWPAWPPRIILIVMMLIMGPVLGSFLLVTGLDERILKLLIYLRTSWTPRVVRILGRRTAHN